MARRWLADLTRVAPRWPPGLAHRCRRTAGAMPQLSPAVFIEVWVWVVRLVSSHT